MAQFSGHQTRNVYHIESETHIMSALKTATHPAPECGLVVTFDAATHTYREAATDREYISATTFVKRFFPPFDESAAAARVAARESRLDIDVLNEWRAKREASATFGTAVHAYAERCVNAMIDQEPLEGDDDGGEQDQTPAAISARQAVRLALAGFAASNWTMLGAEVIVFDPAYRIAGTIDLLMRDDTGRIIIADWKTCETLTDQAWGNALPPIPHVRDSKIARYGLQLSLYARILTDAHWIGADESVDLALIHLPPGAPEPAWMPVANARAECDAMVGTWFETLKESYVEHE